MDLGEICRAKPTLEGLKELGYRRAYGERYCRRMRERIEDLRQKSIALGERIELVKGRERIWLTLPSRIQEKVVDLDLYTLEEKRRERTVLWRTRETLEKKLAEFVTAELRGIK